MRFSYCAGMIWSVSTSARSSGTAMPSMRVSAPCLQILRGREVAGDRGGGGDARAHEVRATALALAALEVAIAGRRARSPGDSLSGFMPRHIEQPALRHSNPAATKTSSSPSASACAFTRDAPGTTSARSPRARSDRARRRPRPQVLDARVRARSDEHGVGPDVSDRRARLQAHIGERAHGGFIAARAVGGTAPSIVVDCAGLVPQRDVRLQASRRRSSTSVSNTAPVVGRQRAPVVERRSQSAPSARRAALDVGERGVVRRDDTGAAPPRSTCCRSSCAPPSRAPDRTPRYSMTGRSRRRCRCGDDREDDVLRAAPRWEIAVDGHRHLPRPDCGKVCVASTCSTSLVPMPNASAPNAP